MSYYPLDLTLFFIINIANIIISAIFILRVKKPHFEHLLGIFYILLGIPTLVIAIFNFIFRREWWFYVFPLLFGFFIIFELIIDYIKKVEFRNPRNKTVLVPYLILYYILSLFSIKLKK